MGRLCAAIPTPQGAAHTTAPMPSPSQCQHCHTSSPCRLTAPKHLQFDTFFPQNACWHSTAGAACWVARSVLQNPKNLCRVGRSDPTALPVPGTGHSWGKSTPVWHTGDAIFEGCGFSRGHLICSANPIAQRGGGGGGGGRQQRKRKELGGSRTPCRDQEHHQDVMGQHSARAPHGLSPTHTPKHHFFSSSPNNLSGSKAFPAASGLCLRPVNGSIHSSRAHTTAVLRGAEGSAIPNCGTERHGNVGSNTAEPQPWVWGWNLHKRCLCILCSGMPQLGAQHRGGTVGHLNPQPKPAVPHQHS